MDFVAELDEVSDSSVQIGGPAFDKIQYMRAGWAALVPESDDALDLTERQPDRLGGTDETEAVEHRFGGGRGGLALGGLKSR